MSQVTENTSSPLAETGNWLWTPVTSHREKRAQTEVGAGAWGPPVLSLSCHRVSQRTALGLSPRQASDALRPESARVGRLAGPRIRSQVPGEESAESPPARGSRAARVECGAPRLPPPAVTRSGLAARGRVIASPASASRRPCRGPYVQRWLTCAILPGSRWVTVRTQACRPQAQELWARGAAWPGPAAATAPAAHGETPGVPDARCDTGRSRASSFRWAPPPPRSRIWFCDRPCAAISE